MAAKKIRKWQITLGGIPVQPNPQFVEVIKNTCQAKTAEIARADTHVCPHCDEPWPMFNDDEPSECAYYRCGVEEGDETYCCDATRRDCEGAND